MNLGVVGNVSDGYVLPISSVVRKSERGLLQHAGGSLWATSVLNVRLTCGVRRREKEAVLLSDERSEALRDLGLNPLPLRFSRTLYEIRGAPG